MKLLRIFIFTTLLMLMTQSHIFAVTYYVSNTGNDDAAGTSTATAWKTPGRVSWGDYAAGSKIAFKGGQTFTGAVYLSDYSCHGTAASPVTVTSYGTGKATISSGNGSGISVFNTAGIKITNLNIRGLSQGTGIRDACGIVLNMDMEGGIKLDGVTITNVNVSGYGGHGIYFAAWNDDLSASGYKNISITRTIVNNNDRDGILFSLSDGMALYTYENVYVANCVAYNNFGIPDWLDSESWAGWNLDGDGILFMGVDGGTIQNCTAYNNGANSAHRIGGPYGIWGYNSNNLTIQYCESYNNSAGTGGGWDGGGFDFDEHVLNSTIQYNYAHGNDGPGMLLGGETIYNTVRYNIFENNGRKMGQGELYLGGYIEGAVIYNNTLYTDGISAGFRTVSPAVQLAETWQGVSYGSVSLHNNIFLTASGKPQIRMIDPQFLGGLYLDGNIYWNQGTAGNFLVEWGGQTYTDMTLWQWASGGQELGGYNIDPRIANPGRRITARTVSNYTATLNKLLPYYKLRSTSELIDAAWDLTLWGIDVGTRDIFGQPTPTIISHDVSGYDIGAVEYQPGQ